MSRKTTPYLTERQCEVLDWIRRFIRENRMPPTVREIGGAFGIESSTVFGLLKALEKKGRLRRGSLGARSLIIEGGRPKAGTDVGIVTVPMRGRIAAGVPIFAVQEAGETISVEERLARGQELYALRVEGTSMADAGILDGDVVIIRKQETVDDGDIAVARIGDEATLKRLYRERERIRLEPANRGMKPIYAAPDEVFVQGKVIAVRRLLDA